METIQMLFWGIVNVAIHYWYATLALLVLGGGSVGMDILIARRKAAKQERRVAVRREGKQQRKIVLKRMKKRLEREKQASLEARG